MDIVEKLSNWKNIYKPKRVSIRSRIDIRENDPTDPTQGKLSKRTRL